MRISDWSSDVCSSDLEHHLIADREIAYVGTDRKHFAGRFMAEHHRHHARARAIDHRQIGMAEPGCTHFDQQFAGTRRIEFDGLDHQRPRSEEHTSELQSLMRISYAVFCLKKQQNKQDNATHTTTN